MGGEVGRLEGGCVVGEVGVCVMGLEVGGWEEVPTYIYKSITIIHTVLEGHIYTCV